MCLLGNYARIEVQKQVNYGEITITAKISGTDYVATCILDTSNSLTDTSL